MCLSAVLIIRGNRNHVAKRDVFGPAEQGHKYQSCENRALHGDRDEQRAPANASLTSALLGIGFHEAILQRAETFLLTRLGNE